MILLCLLASTAMAQSNSAKRTMLVMGDSLSAGYGIAQHQGWVNLTAEKIKRSHPQWSVINASISGETTAGGASRIQRELQRHKPALVVIELGANDGLRGLPLAHTRSNLEKMIRLSQASGAKVLLIGIQLPPNFGKDYTQQFASIYSTLSKQYKTALVPFLLEPIAMDRTSFQADQIHPTAAAQPKLRDHVGKVLIPMLN
jgi:acyl-CoA thioesterase-1